MSSDNSKKMIMLELDAIASLTPEGRIATVAWNAKLGKKLKEMRGKVSRRVLAAKVIEQYNYKVSQQYIQLLEHPEASDKAPANVSFKLLRYLTAALDGDIYELFDSPEIITRET